MRIINGQPANNLEQKRKAVETYGGNYNENIEGDFVQGDFVKKKKNKSQKSSGVNYIEQLGGKYIDGDFVEK